MSEVSLFIHGRSYGVGCDDGQEKRVRELGQYIDKKVQEIAGPTGGTSTTEAHLLVLACLVLADELFETREGIQQFRSQTAVQGREIENLKDQVFRMAQGTVSSSNLEPGMDPDTEVKIAEAIENLSDRLETIAKRLQAA